MSEEEELEQTEQAYQEVVKPKLTFWERVRVIATQILITTFSVTLSIWLVSYNSQRTQQNEAKSFLMDLKTDLNNDISVLSDQKQKLANSIATLSSLDSQTTRPKDADKSPNVEFFLISRKVNDGNFEAFKSGGKIGFIDNKIIKKDIFNYYQQSMRTLEEIEKIYNTKTIEIGETWGAKTSPEEIYADKMLGSKIILLKSSAGAIIERYDKSIQEARTIVTEIDEAYK